MTTTPAEPVQDPDIDPSTDDPEPPHGDPVTEPTDEEPGQLGEHDTEVGA